MCTSAPRLRISYRKLAPPLLFKKTAAIPLVSLPLSTPVDDDLSDAVGANGVDLGAKMTSQAKNLYKLMTADGSQLCDGRIKFEVTGDIKRNSPINEPEEKDPAPDTDDATSIASSSKPQPKPVASSATKVTLRKKSKPRHRDPEMNDKVSSIIRSSRFSFDTNTQDNNSKESSVLSGDAASRKRLSKSLPPISSMDKSTDRPALLRRCVSSGWVPGVEFSPDMEVYFFKTP